MKTKSKLKPDTPKRRMKKWMRVIKQTHDWDWTYLLDIWIYALVRMRDNEVHFGHHTTSLRDAKRMTKVIDMLSQVRDPNTYVGSLPLGASLKDYKREERRQQRDLEKALQMVAKYLFTWWD